MSVENIKKLVSSSRLDYLYYKFEASSRRNKHLLTIQHQHKRTTERMKTRCRNCKSASIKKVECTACGCVTQVTSQHLIEQSIMKENSNRFILACSSPLLQDEKVHDLGFSGEGKLSKNTQLNRTELETSDERLKDLMRLFIIHQTYASFCINFAIE